MKRLRYFGVVFYLVLVCIAAGCFVAGGVLTWKARNFWEKQLRQVQMDCVKFAQDYRASFQELNISLLRYRLEPSAAERNRFRMDADRLARQMAQLDRNAFVPESKQILLELTDQFARYRLRAEALIAEKSTTTPPDLLVQVEAAAQRIISLDLRLTAIQQDELASFVTRVRLEMDRLFTILYVSMFILVVSGAGLAWVGYRDLIAPLRRTVVKSRRLLEQKEKLAALGLLTAGIAHEIRNPLNSIKARLFTQRRMLGESSPGLEDNQFIEGEVDRLESIVEDALQFARPAQPSFEPLRLATALEPWCGMLESSLRSSAIELKSEFVADPPVRADLNQLKQAILNLVKNAAESIGRNGTITLRSVPAFLRLGGRKRSAVALEIEDTGPGISPQARHRLFDPFFTTKENGTGLGLSIAARIAHAHGGSIEFGSPTGRGAVFRIVLPIA